MARKVDAPSRWADLLTKALFTGKRLKKFGISKEEARQYARGIASYLTGTNPPLGPSSQMASQLASLVPGLTRQATGLYDVGQGFLGDYGTRSQDFVNTAQGFLPMYQSAVERGLAGNLYDIGPQRAMAERELMTQTRPMIGQSFAALNTPLSSDLTGQMVGARRDMELDLAAQEALMNYQAQQALATGGANQFLSAAQMPAQMALPGAELAFQGGGSLMGGATQIGQQATNLANLDALQRMSQQSTLPGAASLFPSAISGTLSPLSQISSAGRTIAEV